METEKYASKYISGALNNLGSALVQLRKEQSYDDDILYSETVIDCVKNYMEQRHVHGMVNRRFVEDSLTTLGDVVENENVMQKMPEQAANSLITAVGYLKKLASIELSVL